MIAGFAKTHAFCDTLEYISERRKNTHYLSFMTYLAFQINYISASSMYFGHIFFLIGHKQINLACILYTLTYITRHVVLSYIAKQDKNQLLVSRRWLGTVFSLRGSTSCIVSTSGKSFDPSCSPNGPEMVRLRAVTEGMMIFLSFLL